MGRRKSLEQLHIIHFMSANIFINKVLETLTNMSSSSEGTVDEVTPPDDYCPPEDIRFIPFSDFKNNLSKGEDEVVESPEFSCAGYKWKLIICPSNDDISEDGFIGVYLRSMEPIDIAFDYAIYLKTDGDSDGLARINYEKNCFSRNSDWIGDNNCFQVSKVLQGRQTNQQNGTLTFAVSITPAPTYYTIKQQSSFMDYLQKRFLDSDDADVAFKVKGEIFLAHRVILKCSTPDLAELCKNYDVANPMPIDDVEPGIFETFLKVAYGASITAEQWKANSQKLESIILAAGKYGFNDVKKEAEAWYITFLDFTLDNVLETLIDADANNLSSVKNAAMDFILENAGDFVASESYSLLCQSPTLLKEVMQAMAEKLSPSSKRKRDR